MIDHRDKNERSPRWVFLLYLCDDHELLHSDSPRELLDTKLVDAISEISDVKNLKSSIDVIYQYDSFSDLDRDKLASGQDEALQDDMHCALRHLSWRNNCWEEVNADEYKYANTGDVNLLTQFFDWGSGAIEKADHVALIFSGLGVGDKGSRQKQTDPNGDYEQIFSICDDLSAKDALNPTELREALQYLVREYRDTEPIDLLGFDMSSMQFIEVAHQFSHLAEVRIASHNNQRFPCWPYGELLLSLIHI